MTGGLMQLVAYGAQDIYLTGNPMITYFKVVYRRHTNFAMESIQQTFSGNVAFGSKVSALISRNGDLVNGMTLEATLPATNGTYSRWTDDVGHHLIKQVEVEIGGQLIDRQYSDWLEIWAQLTVTGSQKAGYRKMIGQDAPDQSGQSQGLQAMTNAVQPARKLYIPLQFWFCRNVGLSLPLIALQYHEVKVNITFETTANLLVAGAVDDNLVAELWVDYIYLDTDERRRFAQVSHEYLIEQLQYSGEESVASTSATIELNLNHPVKELIWVAREAAAEAADQWSNYTTAVTVPIQTVSAYNQFDGQPENFAGNAANRRRPHMYEAQGQWFTKPRDIASVAPTARFTQFNGNAGNLNTIITAAGHGLQNGEVVIVTARPFPNVQLSTFGAVPSITTYIVGDVTLNTFSLNGNGIVNFPNFGGAAPITVGRYLANYVPVEGVNPIVSAKLQLNGHDRFALRSGDYFNLVQTQKHHTSIPDSPGINVYSFALKPEEHQPSGTCNFSRIDNAKLHLTLADATARGIKVFATNYNVLRVMSGMGGLAYSN